jgi:N-acetylmuramoyl-L-alanine amidase
MEKLFHKNIGKITFIVCLPLILAFATQKAHGFDENGDRLCLAQNIYFEAGNQPLAGRIAVANVTLNRVEDLQFPETICDVVYQSKAYYESWSGNKVPVRGMCQFSWYCDGKSDEPKDSRTWVESIRSADMVLNEKTIDITDGALWYHADYVYPYWADHLTKVITIENHIFYK